MAQYNSFSDVADNPRFAAFVKEKFGIDDVAKISQVEQNSMLYVFKSFEGDLDHDGLFAMFHEMGEAQHETGQVSDEEVNRFIAAKEEYLRRNPQEKEQVNADIERFLNNDLQNGRESQTEMFGGYTYTFDEAFRNRYHKAQEDYLKTQTQTIQNPPIWQTLKEDRLIPDLAQSVLQMGFNNQGIESRLKAAVDNLPDGREKDMFSKVLEAYIERNNAHTVNASKVVALNDLIVNEEDVEIAKRITATLGWWEGDYPEMHKNIEVRVAVVPTPDPRPQPQPEPEPQPQPEPVIKPVTVEEVRIRSHDNFDNESAMYRIELAILAERKLIPAEEAQKAIDTYTALLRERDIISGLTDDAARHFASNVSVEDLAKAYELVNKGRDKIAESDTVSYKQAIVDKVLDAALQEQDKENGNDVWYGLLTPELTAVGIKGLQERLDDKSLKEEEKDILEKRLGIVVNHGEGLLQDLTKKEGYYFTDITNAADEYDGYMHLADTCEKVAKAKENGQTDNSNPQDKQSSVYENARNLMNEYIKPYDELYNIPSGKNPKDTAIDLNDRFKKATAIIDKLEFNEDTLGKEYMEAIQNYMFVSEYDAQGNPKYEECIKLNNDGKMEVVKGSSLETALKFAANEAMMQNLGNFSQKIDKNLIMEGVKDNAFNTLFAYSNSEEVIKQGLRENPQKFTDPKYVEEFKQKLMSGHRMELSPLGAKLAMDRQANNVETFSNRLTSKLGKDNTEYLTAGLLGQIKKIDKTSKYVDNSKRVKNSALKRNLLGIGFGFGIATVASYASTKLSLGAALGIGQALPVAGGMAVELGIGGVSAAIGAVAGAAVSTLSYLAVKKIGATIKRQKYGWKDVKKDLKSPQFISAVTAGALGGASVGFALSACPKCAMACGVASLAVASAGRFYAPYRDMRLHGHGRVKSAVMGIANATAVLLGGKLGHELASNNNHVEITANDKQAKELYKDVDQAEKDGWKVELSNKPKEGFTLLRSEKGPEYHQYSEQEMAWANKRSDGIRFSEFLNGGKGGLHVDPDYQNGLGGLNHDQVLHDNAIKTLNEMASRPGNEWMNTLTNGKANPNSEMLLYKVYQMRVLAPNENTPLPNTSQTVGEFFKADNNHTYSSLYEKLLNGKSLDKLDLQVLSKIENHVGGQLDDKVNDLGKIIDVKGATHPQNTPVDSYNSSADKGYDLLSETKNLFGRFTKSVEAVSGFGATILSWPRKVKDFLRPGAKADRIGIVKKTQNDTPETTVIGGGLKKKDYVKSEITIKTQPVQDVIKNKLLNEEYQMLHGYKPTADDKQYLEYVARTEKEFKDKPEFSNMVDFLKDRKQRMNNAVIPNVNETNITQTIGKDDTHLGDQSQVGKSKLIEDFENKRANSTLTAAIRQDFWKNNNKVAKEWSFEDLISHVQQYAPQYMQQITKEATNIDEKKTAMRNENNQAGKISRIKQAKGNSK